MMLDTDRHMTLNPQQAEAYAEIMSYLKSGKGMVCLKGYAGTGKTSLMVMAIKEYRKMSPRAKISITAPTNKAVMVIQNAAFIKNRLVKYSTIHSLLKMKEQIDENGRIDFVEVTARSVRSMFSEEHTIDNIDVLVVDEVSMLDDFLFHKIKMRAEARGLKVIFMGDPAQIPPVNKADCEVFLNPDKHNIKTLVLTQIMRQQDGSKITFCAYVIRKNLERNGFKFEGQEGGDLQVKNRDFAREEITEMITKSFMRSDNDCKIIAYTNERVNSYNNYVRSIIWKDREFSPFHEGEKLIMNAPITDDLDMVVLTTNQEVMVVNCQLGRVEVYWKGTDINIPCYKLRVLFINKFGFTDGHDLMILHPDGAASYTDISNGLRNDALEAFTNEVKRENWRLYYGFIRQFANVSYGYAITAHKAQGSTYDECFVDSVNIHQNKNVVERNRILYTAMTRPKNNLIIIE